MWRVLLPLVMAMMGPVEPAQELLYVRDGWVWGKESGQLWEGEWPTRCADGSVVYVHEGDLWRDGVRIEATAESEHSPSCVEDILYDADGYVWRYHEGEREMLWRGENPAVSPDGRIAYRDWFQGVQAVYVWDDGDVAMTYPGNGYHPDWGEDGKLYVAGGANIGYWDGAMHWLDINGTNPCWTPDGLYYVSGDGYPYHVTQWNIYLDGEVVVEDAWQPAW